MTSSMHNILPPKSPSGRLYALVDVNNMYVSCERVFNPKLEGVPVDRGLAGPGLPAHVLVSKFADHPVNRVQDFLPWNVNLHHHSN